MSASYYEELFLEQGCSIEKIKEQYYKLAKQFHPDQGHGDYEKFKRIQIAFSFLKDKHQKEFYDIFGDRGIVVAKDSRTLFLLTRVFSRKTLFTIMAILIQLVIIFYLLPVYISLRGNKIISIKFFWFVIPLFATFLFLILFLVEVLFLFSKQKQDYRNELLVGKVLLLKIIFISLQSALGVFYADGILCSLFIFLKIIPYLLFELLTGIETYVKSLREDVEKRRKMLLNALFTFLIRFFCILFFFCPLIPAKFKILFVLLISSVVILIVVRMPKLPIVGLILVTVMYFIGLFYYENLICNLLSKIFLVPPFLFVGYIIVYHYKEWRKIIPRSMYLKQPMLYDETNNSYIHVI